MSATCRHELFANLRFFPVEVKKKWHKSFLHRNTHFVICDKICKFALYTITSK